jgi:hypothetical protein
MWLRWFVREIVEAGFILALCGALLVPVVAAYDLFRFSSIREGVDDALAKATPSERNPTEAVKRAFRLSGKQAMDLYRIAANSMFRRRLDLARPRNYPSALEKSEVVLGWTPLLRFHYSTDEMVTVILTHYALASGARVGTGRLSVTALGRDLNDLTPHDLECMAKVLRVASSAADCAAIERQLSSALPRRD